MTAIQSKQKTILRVKRKYSDIVASDIILLSQPPKAKRQRTIPWDELTDCFNNTSLSTIDTDKKSTRNIPNFFDYDYEKARAKKHVFRLIGKDSVSRNFQSTNFKQNASTNLKLKVLEERRTNRKQYFSKMKHERAATANKLRSDIIQHEDDLDEKHTFVCTKNGVNKSAKQIEKQRMIKLNKCKNKLLEKQKASRSTKIATKKQMNALRAKTTSSTKQSAFCDDWNDCSMISVRAHDGEWINIRNVKQYTCFDGYMAKSLDCAQEKGVNIVSEMETDCDMIKYKCDNDEYDYYELDEEANVDQVIAAIQARIEWKKEEEINESNLEKKEEIIQKMKDKHEDSLDLEWKLETIKNKHLTKHFDANYEAPSYGVKCKSKESEDTRFGEMERSAFVEDDTQQMWMNSNQLQSYYEKLINEEDEIEKDDEGYICNQYPDEHEFSQEDEYCLEDDYYPRYNDKYHENALDIDFFNEYEFT